MKTPHRIRGSGAAFLSALALLAGSQAHADVLRGQVVNTDSVSVDFVYESTTNSFAIDIKPLFEPRLAGLEFAAVPKGICDALGNYVTTGTEGLDSTSVRLFQAPASMSLKVRVAKPYLAPEYATLVQAELKARGIQVALPKNATSPDRISLQLGFKWDDGAISVQGKHDLVSKAQSALANSWSVTDDASGINATAKDGEALVSTLCDLQSRHLSFMINYEYQDRFFYFEQANAQAGSMLELWQRLSAKSAWVNQFADRDTILGPRDARLVAAGSLLTLELLRMNPNSPLLEPDAFVKIHTALFNPVSGELNRWFGQESAEDLANRLGKSNQVNFPDTRGVKNL